jgi:superfamily I DNA/RNA helicase
LVEFVDGSWRFANCTLNLRSVRLAFPEMHQASLRTNFRSSQNIVTSSLAVLSGFASMSTAVATTNKQVTANGPGHKVLLKQFADPIHEAAWVATKISELIPSSPIAKHGAFTWASTELSADASLPALSTASRTSESQPVSILSQFDQIAVLMRSNSQVEVIVSALQARNIPVRLLTDECSHISREITLLMAFLELFVDPTDEYSFEKLVCLLYFCQ